MKNITSGALPTANITGKNTAAKARLKLFKHYLNHKVNSERTVLENIIISFNKKYRPERYFIKPNENSKITDDSLQDIRSIPTCVCQKPGGAQSAGGHGLQMSLQPCRC